MTTFQVTGEQMHAWASDLFPINRSITGEGVRSTLAYLAKLLPGLNICEIPTGTKVLDWIVPQEWEIREAWVEDKSGNRIIDFKKHNLHVVGYSVPVDCTMELSELQTHLYSLPEQPDAIPYVTSYYSSNWGFCLTHNQRTSLKPGVYRVKIDSELKHGVLNYGELIIKGEVDDEVFLSTYICHPSMANNELSGPVVTGALAQWLLQLSSTRYTYRIIFIPETIGSVAYLSRKINHLKKNVVAGYNVTCIGDDRCYSYLPSRKGNTLSDRIALHVLKYIDHNFKSYSWLDRGSDERQYCAPGVDLPIASIMRSKYAEYPEYHTSLDDLSFVTASGLEGGFMALKRAIECIESNCIPRVTTLGEPQLGTRGLYPSISMKGSADLVRQMMDFISYADGENDLIDIADKVNARYGIYYRL